MRLSWKEVPGRGPRSQQERADSQARGDADLYHVDVIPTTPFLVFPEVSSDRCEYTPIGWLEPPVIPSNKLRHLANLTDFALLTSTMHMAWTQYLFGIAPAVVLRAQDPPD